MHVRMAVVSLFIGICFAPTGFAHVDYTKCADFFNNDASHDGRLTAYRIKESGPFVPRRLRYVPFDLDANGEVSVHAGARIHKESDHAGKTTKEVVSYDSPTLESLETLDIEQLHGKRNTRAIVERNSDGHIVSITEGLGLVADEEEETRRIEEWNGGYSDLAFAYRGTKTTFGVTAGECVPLDSKEVIARKKNGKWHEAEILVFSTKLCRKVYDFIDDNPEARSAFDSELNRKMTALFAEHARDLLIPEDLEREFLSDSRVSEFVGILNEGPGIVAPERSLKLQVYSAFKANTLIQRDGLSFLGRELRFERKKFGVSPVISGHMILANCYIQRLTPFFWPMLRPG